MRLFLLIGILLAALAFAFLGNESSTSDLAGQAADPVLGEDGPAVPSDASIVNDGDVLKLTGDEESEEVRVAAAPAEQAPVPDYYMRTADMFSSEKMLVATVVRDETDVPIPGALLGVYTPAYHERGITTDENGMFTLPIPDVPEYHDEHSPLSSSYYPTKNWTFFLQNGALGEHLIETIFTVERGDNNEPVLITLRIRSLDKVVSIRVVSPGSEPLPCEVFFQAIGHALRSSDTNPNYGQEDATDLYGSELEQSTRAGRPTEDTVSFDYEAHQGARGFRIWALTREGYVAPPIVFEPETLPDLVHVQLIKCATLSVAVLTHGGEAVRDIRVESIPDSSMRGLTQTLGRRTDAAGRAKFEDLLPIRVNVNVFLRKGGLHTVSGIQLQPGEDRQLEIRLRDEGPVAITGRVVDEEGKPLRNQPIAIEFGAETASAQTSASGEFTFHSDAEGPFVVSANRSVSSDTFEPPLVHAQHGTRNIMFRRTAHVSLRPFSIAVFDAVTLESLGDVATVIDRGAGTEAWSETRSARSSFTERIDANTRLRIELEGYQPFALGLAAALANSEPDAPLIVVLEPVD
jgi:hypothetical protein